MATSAACDVPVCEDCGDTMDQVFTELGINEDSCSVHSDIIVSSDGIITESMLAEEKALLKQTSNENQKLLEENISKENEISKEDRFKQLQHLLGRSKFYTKYLQDKITHAQNAVLQKRIKKEKPEKTALEPLRTRSAATINNAQNAVLQKIIKKEKVEVKQEKDAPEPLKTRSTAVNDSTKPIAKPQQQSPVKLKRGSRKDLNTRALKIPKLELRRLEDCSPEELEACTKKPLKRKNSESEAPVLLTGGVMRSYQLEGYHWLKVLYENGVNGILGDEMGLGKTIQCIALIAHLIEHGVTGPFLICSPLSTLPNWIAEFERFTPKIPTILYHGSKDERSALHTKFKKIHSFDGFSAVPVIITSYEVVIRDSAALGHYEWKYIIVDEGHRIKNMNCLLVKRLKELHSVNRLLLTGTPLQNNLAELWSLLNFILPELFDNLKIFESWFEAASMSEEGSDERIVALEKENHILATLHEILTPFLLRRVKTDVDLFIPPKRELIVYAPMTAKQHTYYKAIVDKTINDLVGSQESEEKEIELPKKRIPNLNSKPAYETHFTAKTSEVHLRLKSRMVQFRKCVNHPYLFEYPLDPATQEYLINEELVEASGKMQVLDILVKKLIEKGHKILIFSQMVKMLHIIHDFCYMRNYRFVRLDGTMKLSVRQDAIKQFNENPDVSLFLLSTRAGGLGLNLTAADTVIIYDSDWNPQCDLQAMDRCHRIGQTKSVVVYRLTTENSIDQKVVDRAAAKRKLEKMVIHKDKFNNARGKKAVSAISPSELLELLKSTDHDGVISSNKKEVFTKEELDILLDRSFKSKQPISTASYGRVKMFDEEATSTSV